jgi:hypothetical protein
VKPLNLRDRTAVAWTLGVAAAVEAATIVARVVSGTSAAEFQTAHRLPLPLRIHHLFWGLVALSIVPFVWRRPNWERIAGILLGVGLGLVLSDVVHHCIVLPLWVGNMGWHWP